MMKRIAIALLLAAVLFLTGCPVPLITELPSDLVLMLGLFNSTAGVTQVRAAVGGMLDVPVLISDQTGRAVTGSYDVTFTLSTDGDLTTTGDNIDAETVAVTAGAQTIASFAVPAAAVPGPYTLFGVLDADDAATNNNMSSIAADIGTTDLPDLEIQISSAPVWADPGTTITVGYGIYNTGYTTVPADAAFDVEFRWDYDNSVLATDAVTLAEALYPQDVTGRQIQFALPSLEELATADGTNTTDLDVYTVDITAVVDVADTVTEITEGGTDALSVDSGNRKPDLDLNDIILPSGFVAAKIGGAAQLTLEIRNTGKAATGEYGIDLYVDIDGSNNYDAATDFMIHQWAQADTPVVPYDLSGGGNNRVFINTPADAVYDAAITAGTYNIRAEITTAIDEYGTGNNTEVENNVDFVVTIANLSMKFMSTTLASGIDYATGGTIPLSYTLQNDQQDDVTADFDVEFYVSDDWNLGTGDELIATDTVTATVPAGGALVQSVDGAIPATIATGAGFYTVYWVIDSGDVVVETSEGDNTPSQPEQCYVFPIVSDGVTDINTRLLAYKPWGAQSSYEYVEAQLYNSSWSPLGSNGSWGTHDAGDLYFTVTGTLTTDDSAGLRVSTPYGYSNIPVAVRIVPSYVNSIPEALIPIARTDQDPYEPNNSTGSAFGVGGMNNPLFGFLNIWVDYASGDTNDYFAFDVP